MKRRGPPKGGEVYDWGVTVTYQNSLLPGFEAEVRSKFQKKGLELIGQSIFKFGFHLDLFEMLVRLSKG